MQLPYKARIYIISMLLVSLAMLGYLFVFSSNATADIGGFVLFFTLTLLAEMLPVDLPNQAQVTMGFGIWIAIIQLFSPLWATVIISTGMLVAVVIDRKDFVKIGFNVSQLIITIAVASLLYQQLLAVMGLRWWSEAAAIFVAGLACAVINTLLVTGVLALVEGMPFFGIWRQSFQWGLPNYIAMAPLGFLIALIYRDGGSLGVLLFMIPLLLARRSFQLYMDMRQTYLETIESLVNTIDAKDKYTRGHSERVARYTVALAEQMDLPSDRVELLRLAALLHDTGKVGIQEAILNKPGRLSDGEFELMQQHSTLGAEIIKGIKFLDDGYQIILHHHERWDGKGYPGRVAGSNIPLGARIIAVADAFDAMTSDRPYRPALTPDKAYSEILSSAGSQFDPDVAEVFKVIFPEIKKETVQEKEAVPQEGAAEKPGEEVVDTTQVIEGEVSNAN